MAAAEQLDTVSALQAVVSDAQASDAKFEPEVVKVPAAKKLSVANVLWQTLSSTCSQKAGRQIGRQCCV